MLIRGLFSFVLLLFAFQSTVTYAADLKKTKYRSETLVDAAENLRKAAGKKDFESFYDGDLLIVRLDDKERRDSSFSSQQSRVAHHFTYACYFETGKYYLDKKGRRQMSNWINAQSGVALDVRLKSRDGTSYLQPISGLLESVVESIRGSSRFEIRPRNNDDWISGSGGNRGYRRSDNVYFCAYFGDDFDDEDHGPSMKYLLSNKFVDAKTGRYLSVYLHGPTLHQAFETARVENTQFAEESAEAEAAAARKRDDVRQAERDRLEAKKLAEEEAIAAFRANLGIGDETQCGYVIGLRLPMVEVADGSGPRWMRVEDLVPKDTPYKRCPMTEEQISELERSKQSCEARKQSCLANCYSRMTTTDISAPSAAQLLCRDSCEKIICE